MNLELRWVDPAAPDDRDVAGAVAIAEAARVVDAPHRGPVALRTFLDDVRLGWDGRPDRHAVVVDKASSAVVALAVLELPYWDNRHCASVDVVVDPAQRHRGIGRWTAGPLVEAAAEAGRTLLIAGTWGGAGTAEFARSLGMERASAEVVRRLDLTTVDRNALEALRAGAARHAGAYELVRVPGPTPEPLTEAFVVLSNVINDSPLDDLELEDEVFTADRNRAFEATQVARGRRLYAVAAFEATSRAPAGLSAVVVEADHPWICYQLGTMVARAHRGHRLGMLLKTSMLGWLAEAEPQLRTIDTTNAATNDHMVAINVELGFAPIAREVIWQRHLG